MSDKFDWYLSPADRFNYESQFTRYEKNGFVTLKDLDPLFNQSRISTTEFLQIWQLIDIRLDNRIDKIQFVYFSHCLTSRRRGALIPVGLPLNIKEEFLSSGNAESPTSKIYVRPNTNVRDAGYSLQKSVAELKKELIDMQVLYKSTQAEYEVSQKELQSIQTTVREIQEMANYSALKLEAAEGVYTTSGITVGAPVDVDGARLALVELERDLGLLTSLAAEAESSVVSV